MKSLILASLPLFSIALLAGLTACAPQEKKTAATLVPQAERSPAFDTVAKELDLGGELFFYMDTQGDGETVGKLVQQMGDMVSDIARGEGNFVPPLNLEMMWAKFGFNSIEAVGMSSVRAAEGNGFRNRMFFYIPEGREGFMLVTGGEPRPFMAYDFAPEGSDVVYEADVYYKTLFEVVRQIGEVAAGPMANMFIQSALDKPIRKNGVTWGDLLGKLDTRLLMVIDVDDSQMLDFEKEGYDLEFPKTEVLFVVENLGAYYQNILDARPPKTHEITEEKEIGGLEALVLTPPSYDEFAAKVDYLKPTLAHDEAGRLYIATSPEYLERCLKAKGALRSDKSFKEVMAEVPEEGNALGYVSGDIFPLVHTQLDRFEAMISAAPKSEVATKEKKTILGLLGFYRALIPDVDYPMVSAAINRPDGILYTGNACYSHKATLVAAYIYNPIMLGAYAGLAVPAIQGALEEAKAAKAAAEAAAVE